jgi:hypothetical protein
MKGPMSGRNAAGGICVTKARVCGTGDAEGGDLLWGGYWMDGVERTEGRGCRLTGAYEGREGGRGAEREEYEEVYWIWY